MTPAGPAVGPAFVPGEMGGPAGPCCDGCDYACGFSGDTCDGLWPLGQNRFWFRGEYLLWWTAGAHIPPLLTTSPAGTSQANSGVLGQPGTTILFGNQTLDEGTRNGGRLTLGYWLNRCDETGVEVSYLGLGRSTEQFQDGSDGAPILALPFFNVESGLQDSVVLAYPNVSQGIFTAVATNDFQTLEVLLRQAMVRNCCSRVDLVAGYRFARLDDSLALNADMVTTGTSPVPVGTTIDVFDSFRTRNEFNGGELGLVAELHRCRWSLESTMKIALGDTHSIVDINGSTVNMVPGGGATVYSGGMLALPSNMGGHSTDQFSVIPELGVTLGYDLTCRLRATFGYSFMYWSGVARPGEQIDSNLNPSQFPPPASTAPYYRPAVLQRTSDFWAQGLNFGLDYRF